MVTVAVAGGTGNMGRTLVEAFLATAKHKVLILSRKRDVELEAQIGAPIIPVDYSNTKALAKTLEDNNVHTVVSGLTMLPGQDGSSPGEIGLIQAADASKTTKRIVSSDWGFQHKEEQALQMASVPIKLEAAAQLKKTRDLEWTVVHCGFFMDYWGTPAVKSYMPPVTLILDIPHRVGAIPGSGDTPVIFTHTTDVAKFVATLLEADSWDRSSHVVGDRVTWNEFVRLAEAATGDQFDVKYDSLENLRKGEMTALPGHSASRHNNFLMGLMATFAIWMETGELNYETPHSLNDRFPEVKPMKVKEMLEKAWK